MNRVIKFRAFDKECNTMRNWEWVSKCEFPFYSDKSGTNLLDNSVFVLMQFTGLLDKNGKEIYEGDILNVKSKSANYPIHYVIVFNKECSFMMRFIDRYIKNEWSFYDKKIHAQPYDVFEVIGNIYENPELLK